MPATSLIEAIIADIGGDNEKRKPLSERRGDKGKGRGWAAQGD
jgi:hypothetical protein